MSARESYFYHLLSTRVGKLQNHLFLGIAAVLLLFTIAHPAQGQTTVSAATVQLNVGLLNLLPEPTTTDPPGSFKHVQPFDFDPGKTYLVQSTWLSGIGCPTDAFTATPNVDFTGVSGTAPLTDLACPTGDSNDQHNEGLLLVKTGPTSNFAAATAELINVKGITLTELGYDIRKSGGSGASPWGRIAVQAHPGSTSSPAMAMSTSSAATHRRVWWRMRALAGYAYVGEPQNSRRRSPPLPRWTWSRESSSCSTKERIPVLTTSAPRSSITST